VLMVASMAPGRTGHTYGMRMVLARRLMRIVPMPIALLAAL